ncbi:MAG: class I SAM-dependent methyltransferase [Leptolyngbyaceae cyanobacterium SU_3_3]|nr:class I SAM-dependent methyltransferase [Leptolyngbyaceae cyanobacterium SU_3_3]
MDLQETSKALESHNIYTSGDYLQNTQTWHVEDSSWKANQIAEMLLKNHLIPASVIEIGCGAGRILCELSKKDFLFGTQFSGYDISPQAISIAQQLETKIEGKKTEFYCEDLLSPCNSAYSNLLMAIDVFEHVPDYMGFLEGCKFKADYKLYHVPLDMSVSSLLRNSFLAHRYTIGHIHYFTADSAIAVLKDTGHEIVDYCYTPGAFGMFTQHPSIKKAIANVPRWLLQQVNLPLTVKLLGGYSLLVLAK